MPVPQTLRIKRKREDEPVDSLYIQASSPAGKKHANEYMFRRLRASAARTSSRVDTDVTARKSSTIPASTDDLTIRDNRNAAQSDQPPPFDAADRNKSVFSPRRFHLSAPAPESITSATQASDSRERRDLVFVEESEPRLSSTQTVAEGGDNTHNQGTSDGAVRRAQERSATNGNLRSDEETLVDTLQAFAAELEPARFHRSKGTAYPKPQPFDADLMDTTEDEYVYDTFVRCEPSSMDTRLWNGQGGINYRDAGGLSTAVDVPAGLSVGLLVIREDDETFWDNLGNDDDQVDAPDWDSEQDDENAENYYGADYPDEELSSDDEAGVSLWRKYNHGSDNEEFGSADEYGADERWARSDDEEDNTGHSRYAPWSQRGHAEPEEADGVLDDAGWA